MKLRYFGHSCFTVEKDGAILLFDPFVRSNPLAQHIDIEDINTNFIFISHAHEDHLADAVELALKSNATTVSNFEIINWLESKGLSNTKALNIGGTIKAGAFDVKCVQAIHSSSFPDGGYGGTAMGFIASSTHESFYYSGDTGIFGDMTLIGEFNRLDFAVFPIGGTFTMDSTDAIRAAKLCKVSKVVGVHYNTFSPIKIDLNTVKKQFEESNIKLILLEIGQEIELE